ncbi:MAG: hypothetical protein WAX69_06155 [Victivallales bacterium]
MKTSLLFILCAAALPSIAMSQDFTPPKPAADESKFGAKISRTMTALATSTPEKKNPVRILFYGQSIIAQSWSHAIAGRLKKEYPNAEISYENRSIGGFEADNLVKTSIHDLYPFYPDLVFFHDYGGVNGALETMIANIRKLTTAEIIILNHHVSHDGNAWVQNEYDKQSQLIRDLAAKYDCELVDVREEWKQYLAENKLEPKALLADIVHLNPKGCNLMEALVWRHLRYNKDFPVPHADWIKNLPAQQNKDGSVKISFTGNRVDLVAGTTDKPGTAKILIDGKAPSANPLAYAITRTNNAPGVWWPSICTISSEKPLLVEDWILKITEISEDAKNFKFEVSGSKTGPDGSGSSEGKFVSQSGRVVIDPRDFTLAGASNYTKKKCPDGFEIKWSVAPMFKDTYTAPKSADPAKSTRTTLVQLIENGPHTLEIIPNGDGAVPVKEIMVYQPALK